MQVGSTAGIRIDLDEVERLVDDLSDAPNIIYRSIKGGFKDAAMQTIVPEIRRRAHPRKWANKVTAKARGVGGVTLTTEGRTIPEGAVIGWQNYGGYAPRPIAPRRRKVLKFPFNSYKDGRPMFSSKPVTKPGRKLPARKFFEKGIEAGADDFAKQVGDRVADRLEAALS